MQTVELDRGVVKSIKINVNAMFLFKIMYG